MKTIFKIFAMLFIIINLSGCNKLIIKVPEYIRISSQEGIYTSKTKEVLDAEFNVTEYVKPVFVENGKKVLMLSSGTEPVNEVWEYSNICFMDTQTYEMIEIDISEYLYCSRYDDIEFEDGMTILEPTKIEYQNNMFYFIAEVNAGQEMLFVVDLSTETVVHSESVKFCWVDVMEVSEDGKYVYVTLYSSENTEMGEGWEFWIAEFDIEKLEFTEYIEDAMELQFSPDYRYVMYRNINNKSGTDKNNIFSSSYSESIIIKDVEKDEVVYENNSVSSDVELSFSSDSKGILWLETEYKMSLSAHDSRLKATYIDLDTSYKTTIFTSNWNDCGYEIMAIGVDGMKYDKN